MFGKRADQLGTSEYETDYVLAKNHGVHTGSQGAQAGWNEWTSRNQTPYKGSGFGTLLMALGVGAFFFGGAILEAAENSSSTSFSSPDGPVGPIIRSLNTDNLERSNPAGTPSRDFTYAAYDRIRYAAIDLDSHRTINVRSEPFVTDETWIASLPDNYCVALTGEASNGWVKAETHLFDENNNVRIVQGYISPGNTQSSTYCEQLFDRVGGPPSLRLGQR